MRAVPVEFATSVASPEALAVAKRQRRNFLSYGVFRLFMQFAATGHAAGIQARQVQGLNDKGQLTEPAELPWNKQRLDLPGGDRVSLQQGPV